MDVTSSLLEVSSVSKEAAGARQACQNGRGPQSVGWFGGNIILQGAVAGLLLVGTSILCLILCGSCDVRIR